jgi:glycerophosphoryl diester phosphodiesterase
MRILIPFLSAAVVLSVGLPLQAQKTTKKILVAHRGASAYAPEHTAAAYTLAIEQGADYVEQDLAVTKDGVLVSIHDLTLERTTNVEEVFPDRFVEMKDGPTPGRHWLVNDFTLAEIKRLDAGAWFDRKFAGERVLTFQEAIDLVRRKPGIGIYPELKDPEFYRQRGIHPEKLFADILRKNGLLADPKMPVILQSFDALTLQNAAREIPQVPRAYLVAPQDAGVLDSEDKVRAIAKWATGVAPNKLIIDQNPALVRWAHAASLTVTPWTFRSKDTTFPSVRDEMAQFLYKYDVDALFTDNPDQFPRKR